MKKWRATVRGADVGNDPTGQFADALAARRALAAHDREVEEFKRRYPADLNGQRDLARRGMDLVRRSQNAPSST